MEEKQRNHSMKVLTPLFLGIISVIGLVLMLDYFQVEADRDYLPRHVRQSWGQTAIDVNLKPDQAVYWVQESYVVPEPPPLTLAEYVALKIQNRIGLVGVYLLFGFFAGLDLFVLVRWGLFVRDRYVSYLQPG